MAWTTIAHDCVKKYNETEHTVTGFAPEYLLNGTDVTMLPMELKQEYPKHNLMQDRETALKNTVKSHNYNKKMFDKNRKHYEFNIGDKVFVENGNKLNRKKLEGLKIGPYEITEKLSNVIYRVNTDQKKTSRSNIYHITKLIPAPAVEDDDYEDEKPGYDPVSREDE